MQNPSICGKGYEQVYETVKFANSRPKQQLSHHQMPTNGIDSVVVNEAGAAEDVAHSNQTVAQRLTSQYARSGSYRRRPTKRAPQPRWLISTRCERQIYFVASCNPVSLHTWFDYRSRQMVRIMLFKPMQAKAPLIVSFHKMPCG